MSRGRPPMSPFYDWMRPEERVPRPRTTPTLKVELAILLGLGLALGALYGLPAVQAYLATWGLVP